MKFECDGDARLILADNFCEKKGVGILQKKDRWYIPTWQEEEAIDYLCNEWDYAYDPCAD